MIAEKLGSFISWLEKPGKFEIIGPMIKGRPTKILDVGCGNHSPSNTKKYFPLSDYYGVDKQVYENDEEDFRTMKEYWEFDVDQVENLKKIPDNFFECIIFSHVIEHTHNGIPLLSELTKKLKQGGVIYIETPSPFSKRLPSMDGTLNFYDDPTHIRVYKLDEINSTLISAGCEVIKSGTRRLLKRILLMPIYALGSLHRFGKLKAIVFWDLTGFCTFSVAVKK